MANIGALAGLALPFYNIYQINKAANAQSTVQPEAGQPQKTKLEELEEYFGPDMTIEKAEQRLAEIRAERAFRKKAARGMNDPQWKAARLKFVQEGDITPMIEIMEQYNRLDKEAADRELLERKFAYEQAKNKEDFDFRKRQQDYTEQKDKAYLDWQKENAKNLKNAEELKNVDSLKKAFRKNLALANWAYNEWAPKREADSPAKRDAFNAYMDLRQSAEDLGMSEDELKKFMTTEMYNDLSGFLQSVGGDPMAPNQVATNVQNTPAPMSDGTNLAKVSSQPNVNTSSIDPNAEIFANRSDVDAGIDRLIKSKDFGKAMSILNTNAAKYGGTSSAEFTTRKNKILDAKLDYDKGATLRELNKTVSGILEKRRSGVIDQDTAEDEIKKVAKQKGYNAIVDLSDNDSNKWKVDFKKR